MQVIYVFADRNIPFIVAVAGMMNSVARNMISFVWSEVGVGLGKVDWLDKAQPFLQPATNTHYLYTSSMKADPLKAYLYCLLI
jgi:hypothetical protein